MPSKCHRVGPGTLLAKVDLKNAFRLCPVRPEDWHLLGIRWRGQYYVDKCLPFGLRSAPFLFNMVAEALESGFSAPTFISNIASTT